MAHIDSRLRISKVLDHRHQLRGHRFFDRADWWDGNVNPHKYQSEPIEEPPGLVGKPRKKVNVMGINKDRRPVEAVVIAKVGTVVKGLEDLTATHTEDTLNQIAALKDSLKNGHCSTVIKDRWGRVVND